MRDPSLVRFRRVVAAATDELERRRQEVNDLNVFPVPDGDTGDNMAMTMRAVLDELDALGDGSLEETTRLGPEAAPDEQDAVLADVLSNALEAGNEAVERGPEQLRALREAGVVDAGAYGLTVIMAGVVAALRGGQVELAHQEVAEAARSLHHPDHESSRYRYCTNFAITGDGLESGLYVPRLERIGDSVLVVGDAHTLRVHVHTDDPQLAVAVFDGAGDVSRLDVADMREQVAERDARLGALVLEADVPGRCAVVAVATGDGVVGMYRQEGAVVVDPGPKMNPSTYELLAAIHSAGADEVVVLPNSPNVVMAAERAAELSERAARVVATRNPQEGLAAIVAFNAASSAEDNAAALWGAVSALATGGIAPAARDDVQGRFRVGDAVGYAGDEMVSWGEPQKVLTETILRLAEGRELVTCIAGLEAPLGREEVEQALPGGLELDFHEGGQPAWWYLLAVE
jgi:dihydroxyacetone kinase-like predicted kinase